MISMMSDDVYKAIHPQKTRDDGCREVSIIMQIKIYLPTYLSIICIKDIYKYIFMYICVYTYSWGLFSTLVSCNPVTTFPSKQLDIVYDSGRRVAGVQ